MNLPQHLIEDMEGFLASDAWTFLKADLEDRKARIQRNLLVGELSHDGYVGHCKSIHELEYILDRPEYLVAEARSRIGAASVHS